MKSIQDLREQRSSVAQNMKALLDDNKDKKWESSHQEKYDSYLKEVDALDADIKNVQNYMDTVADEHMKDKQEETFNGKTKDKTVRDIHAKWLRGGDSAINAEEWGVIRNTLSTSTGSEGGYSVQSEVAQTLVEALKAYGGVREVATVIQTEMGNPLSFPTTDGTAEVGELIGENTTATDQDPTFGTVPVDAYKFSSKVVAVPFELLQDSQIDIESFVNSRLIDRLGRVTNQYLTTGTGTSQPGGIVTGASSGKVGTTGQTTSIIYDDLVDLVHSVDPAYRRQGGTGFMMNDASLKVIRKIKDSQGRPIFLPGYDGLSGPMADTILGESVTINQDVAVMAASAKSILFGDFSKYIVRDVMQASLFRFTDSAYAKLGQVGFLMWMRAGGNLTDSSAVKYYQNSAT
ncbi:MAG: HK97 family phage major capsid protein [Cycloclasticus pugetii]|jgi:HK97 family phage major capsid protein